jgi:FdhD protein
MADAVRRVPSRKVARAGEERTNRTIPEETPVALVHDGSTFAVMMATPRDLEDFGLGFSLTEGAIGNAGDIVSLDVVEHDLGVEIRMWLKPGTGRTLVERRRRIAGPTGCGLCGVESLEAAVPPPPRVTDEEFRIAPEEIRTALAAMAPAQKLNAETHAVHAAAFWSPGKGIVALREDVGRHNALDKLVGAVVRSRADPKNGIVLLTSRVSVEMVQKTAHLGSPVIVAVSAPTALALRTAEKAGITLVAVARTDAFEIFTHPHRITLPGKGAESRESAEKAMHA